MDKYFDYWLPIYKKQYFKYKLTGDYEAIIDLIDNVWRNWNLTIKEKRKIICEIKGAKK
jgi:hypothetical protein